jgi:hypothetical protein
MNNKILFIYSFLFVSMIAKGQISEVNKRIVRFESIELLDRYNELSKDLKTRDQHERFKEIFEDDAKINNDILGDNDLNENLSIDEFIEKRLENKTKVNSYTIKPYKIEVIESNSNDTDDEYGEVLVYVKKSYSEVVYQEWKYTYRDTLDLKFVMTYRFTDNPCSHDKKGRGIITDISHCSDSIRLRIKSVETLEEYGKYAFLDIKNTKKIFGYGKKSWSYNFEKSPIKSVIINDSIVDLNEDAVLFYKGIKKVMTLKITPTSERYFQTKHLKLNPESIGSHNGIDKDNKFPLRFRKKSFSIRPNTSSFRKKSQFLFAGSQQYGGNIDSRGFNYGVDLGFEIFNWRQIPLSLSFYTGYSQSSVSFESFSDIYQQSFSAVDPVGDKYQRTSLIQNITETGTFLFDQYPLGLKMSYDLLKVKDRNIGSYLGLGRSYVLNANLEYSSQADAFYNGKYGSQFFNINIGENGVYDFGEFNLVKSSDVRAVKSSFLINIDFGFYFEYKNRLSFDIGVSYWDHPNNMFTESEHISSDPTELNSILLKSDGSSLKIINLKFGIKYYI